MIPTVNNLLISRTDNIGDVILTLPMATLLKRKYPKARITFLARDYVKAVIDACPHVDAFLSVQSLETKKSAAILRGYDFDSILHVFPRPTIAWLAKKAGIKLRIGTANRWYHYLTCTHRPSLSRANSALHEAELNLKLLSPLGITADHSLSEIKSLITLTAPPNKHPQYLQPKKFNLVIHPFSKGHTREWPLTYFQELIHALPSDRFNILITGTASEKERLKPLIEHCSHVTDVSGLFSLAELLALIAACDGLVANSTGPLHLAAALGIKTLGLFPSANTMNPSRWQPLGKQAQYITAIPPQCPATPCANNNCLCLRAIRVEDVQNRILQWLDSR